MDVEPGQPDGAGARSAQSADSIGDGYLETASIGGGDEVNDSIGTETRRVVTSSLGSAEAVGEGTAEATGSGPVEAVGNGSGGGDAVGNSSGAAEDVIAHDDDVKASPAEADAPPKGKAKRKRSVLFEVAIVLVAALLVTVLLKSFLFQVFVIPSGSMENTLEIGDRILVNRLVYHLRPIDRGDIVVFSGDGSWGPEPPPLPSNPVERAWADFRDFVGVSAPGTDYVKRVIGVPGDHVVCCNANGQITVNGVVLNESSYLYPGDQSGSGDPQPYSIVVPPGRLFVLGDHRSDSADSRYHTMDGYDGTIPENEVVGRAFVVIWPPSRITDLPIPATFQQAALKASAAGINYGPAATGASTAAGVLVWRRRRSRRRAGLVTSAAAADAESGRG
jgi:signal peptidase I